MELCLIREGLARALHRGRDGVRGAGPRLVPDPAVGRRELVEAWRPRLAAGRGGRRLRADRAGRGHRRRGARAARRARRRRLPASPARRSTSPTRPTPTSTPSSPARPGSRRPRDHGVRSCPRDARGPLRRADRRSSPRTRSAGCVFDGVVVPARARARRGRPRLRASRWARSTSSAPPSAPPRSAWRRRRWPRPSRTRPRERRSAGRCGSSRPSRTGSPTSPRASRPRRLLVHHAAAAYDAGIRPGDPDRGDGEAARHRDRAGGGRRRHPGPRRRRARGRAPALASVPRTCARCGSTRAPRRSSARSSRASCSALAPEPPAAGL